MVKTSARLLELLSLLQLRRDWTSAELADRLDVSPRTVRADISNLRSLGYRVDARPGVAGGYRLMPGAVMPPLVLNDDEAVAVAVGLSSLATASSGADVVPLTALAKVEQVLPARLRQRVGAVRAATNTVSGTAPPLDLSTIGVLAFAIRGNQRLRFGYTTSEGKERARHTEPQSLVHWGSLWYLLAWDLDRDDWRIFRVDRMTARPPTGATFRPRADPGRDVIDYVTSRIVAAGGERHHARVLVRAPAASVAASSPRPITVEGTDSRTCIIEIDWADPARLALWLVGLDTDLEILEGDELRLAFAELAERLHRATGTHV